MVVLLIALSFCWNVFASLFFTHPNWLQVWLVKFSREMEAQVCEQYNRLSMRFSIPDI